MSGHILFSAMLILLVGVSYVVEGHSSGAPAAACMTLAPDQASHLNAPPQTSEVPYMVDISTLSDGRGGWSYLPGQVYSCERLFA